MPALLTRTSSPPSRACASLKSVSRSAGLLTSPTLPLMDELRRVTCCTASALTSAICTRAPFAAKASAMARPIPPAPAVTSTRWVMDIRLRLFRELGGDLGDVPALVARAFQVELGGLAASVAAGDGGRTVRRVAHDLRMPHLALECIGQADHHESEVHENRHEREDRRLLAAVLRRRRGEDAGHLAD